MKPKGVLVIMVKEPRLGRVKTRLGASIGSVKATWWYRHQCRRLIGRLRDKRWQVVLAVSPDAALAARCWPANISRIGQGSGDLGRRMTRAISALAPAPVVLIGSDIPGIRRKHIAEGFHAIASGGFAIGPAPDGGYWLIGWANRRRLARDWLDGVRWSSEFARDDTLARMPEPCSLLDSLTDVDDVSDL